MTDRNAPKYALEANKEFWDEMKELLVIQMPC